jgi:hypothetical protein
MNRIPRESERELRELLQDIVLEMYGLSPTPPAERTVSSRTPRKRPESRPSRATFSGTEYRGGAARFTRDGPKPTVAPAVYYTKSKGLRKGPGLSPTGRLPGESDRDYIERRKRVNKAHAAGYAPPRTDEVYAKRNSNDMYWEMGH